MSRMPIGKSDTIIIVRVFVTLSIIICLLYFCMYDK